ncbi:MAG TPA: hypothetical protein ENI94_12755 [Gammaproteobacteria bacterium]|nr:hypothetical protein [Gammaproteobacteria bacterium]
MLDRDAEGNVCAITFEHASQRTDVNQLVVEGIVAWHRIFNVLPGRTKSVAWAEPAKPGIRISAMGSRVSQAQPGP